jgi:site-specific DNA-cytosine methylase
VFIVGSIGDGRCAEILFERASSSGRVEARGDERQGTTATIKASTPNRRNGGSSPVADEFIVDQLSPTLTSGGHDSSEDGRGRHALVVTVDLQQVTSANNCSSPTIDAPSLTPKQRIVAFNANASASVDQPVRQDGNAGTLSKSRPESISGSFGVRRLTPVECERLQGFPDGWTAIAEDGSSLSDSARYQRLGNAVCVNVAHWIGQRIVASN